MPRGSTKGWKVSGTGWQQGSLAKNMKNDLRLQTSTSLRVGLAGSAGCIRSVRAGVASARLPN